MPQYRRSRHGHARKGTRFEDALHLFYFPYTGEIRDVPAAVLDDAIRRVCHTAHSLTHNWHVSTERGLVSIHVFTPLRKRYQVELDEALAVVRSVTGECAFAHQRVS